MESSQAFGPAFPPPRRVFTAPTYSSAPQSSSSSQSNSGVVETLYDHPSVKIVAFTASSRHYSLGGTGLSRIPDVAPGSLSWSSQLERTIAVGMCSQYFRKLMFRSNHDCLQANSGYTAPRARSPSSTAGPRCNRFYQRAKYGASTRPRASSSCKYADRNTGE